MLLFAVVLLSVEVHAADYTYRSGYGLEFSWLPDDRVGITSGNVTFGGMEQLTFWASSKAATSRNESSFYALGYLLKPEMTYYSYSPYRWVETFDARNIQCRYDQQKQVGNDSPSGIVKCDYQMAAATASSDAISFSYKHIGGVLRISFLAPAAMTIASLNILMDMPVLATESTMDIVGQTVTLGERSSSMAIETENISVAKGEKVVLFLALPAQDLSSNIMRLSVKDGNGKEHIIATIVPPDVKAGRLYELPLMDLARTQAAPPLQAEQEKSPQRVAGIANPLAHAEDFLIDSEYKCEVPAEISHAHINKINKSDNSYFNLNGIKTETLVKGNVYIHRGKKIIW